MVEWEAVEGNKNFWNPEKEGEQVIGKIAEIADGMYGKRYTIQQTIDGKEELLTLPSHKVLQGRLSACALGETVKIVYKGTQPPKTRSEQPMKLYEVFREKRTADELVK
jgi:hypothetical protein